MFIFLLMWFVSIAIYYGLITIDLYESHNDISVGRVLVAVFILWIPFINLILMIMLILFCYVEGNFSNTKLDKFLDFRLFKGKNTIEDKSVL